MRKLVLQYCKSKDADAETPKTGTDPGFLVGDFKSIKRGFVFQHFT